MIEMTREIRAVELAVEVEVEVEGDGEEAGVVHVVAAERGTTRGANILVDTETTITGMTITGMIITEIGVPRSHNIKTKPYLWGYVIMSED